jgi:integrase
MPKLTDAFCRNLPLPERGNKLWYDTDVKSLALRVTASGARSFVLTYYTRGGRQRRYTIGRFPDFTVSASRARARELKRRIADGADPLAELEAERGAPTMADLCQRYIDEHLPGKRVSSQRDDQSMIAREILPALGNCQVAELKFTHADALHRKITKRGAPYRANRVLSVLTTMVNLAVKLQWRADNPCRFVERNHEEKRQTFLGGDQIERLTAELDRYEDQQAADIIRLLLLTGARSHEVFSMRWKQVDLETGVWSKPAATTKTARPHRALLSEDACRVIARQPRTSVFVFPGPGKLGHRESVDRPWATICKRAKLEGVRVHDLRHSFASLLVNAGMSLPVVGQMLNHTQPGTTARYSHLYDETLREAAELAAAGVRKPRPGKVLKFR